MNFAIWRGMVEFAENVQCLILNGWRFRVEYGEEKFDSFDRMVFERGNEKFGVRSHSDLVDLIRRTHGE